MVRQRDRDRAATVTCVRSTLVPVRSRVRPAPTQSGARVDELAPGARAPRCAAVRHSTARVVSSHGRGVSMRHGDAKVAFVSDNPGTSYGEVNAVVFVVIVAAWASLTVRERCEAQAWTSAKTTMTTLLVGTETAMLALATLASMFAVTKALAVACAVAGGCFLYWARNARPRPRRQAATAPRLLAKMGSHCTGLRSL